MLAASVAKALLLPHRNKVEEKQAVVLFPGSYKLQTAHSLQETQELAAVAGRIRQG